jgi:hypothetical protein
MQAGKHSLVQHSAYKDAVVVGPIKNDMLLVLDTPLSRPNSRTRSANSRSLDKPIEAGFQAIEIPLSLLHAPSVYGVIGNIYQIEPSQLRELVPGQPSRPARRHSAPSNTVA